MRGFKTGCEGCRIRKKNCAMIRRDCSALKRGGLEFCFECGNFPCQNLEILDAKYQEKYFVSIIENLKRIEEIGAAKWLQEQQKLYICPECGGEICLHDEECYDCAMRINPNKK